MNKIQVVTNALFMIICTVLIQTKSFAEPANLSAAKIVLTNYYNSGQYEKELASVTNHARAFITHRVHTNNHLKHPKQLAIVMDIDETALSDYSRIQAADFGRPLPIFYKNVLAGDMTAIKPTLALYQDTIRQHVAVFFLSGRREYTRRATIYNLKKTGFTTWAGLYLKPNKGFESNIPFKSTIRAEIEKKGYVIVASIGDQRSDLLGGHVEKTFKLPNPFYFVN